MTAAAALRVGRCPGALRPMASGDGLIVRVKPRGGTLAPEAGIALAAAAAAHGNGLLDLTARANLQLRGVTDATLPGLTRALDALGLLDPDAGAEGRRNVVASPLMGLDPAAAFDIRPAVAALEERLVAEAGLDGLPDKFGFAVSDGGAMPLDGVSADLRFAALSDGTFAVSRDGGDRIAALCGAGEVADVAVRLASAFAAARARDPALRRMRDLAASAGVEAPRPGPPRSPLRVGAWSLGQGSSASHVLGIAVAFGRLDAAQLDTLARGAARAGAAELRLTPWRAVLVPGLDRAGAARLAADCAEAGLIVDPADPRLRVAACAGAPGCRRGTTPVLDHAARWATLLGPGDAADGIALHVSGCAKGCAHPASASLTLVAEAGRYALVADGAAGDAPVASGFDADEARRLIRTTLRWDRRP